MNNKTPIKNFIKNRMNNIIHEKDLDSYFFSLFSEKHMYKVFGVNTRIDTLIAIRESNKKFIDDVNTLLTSGLLLTLIFFTL